MRACACCSCALIPARWDHAQIARANAALLQACGHRAAGPYQIEAAIQSAHVHGRLAGAVPWADITRLYEQLLALAPTVGARIAHAVAVAHACDAPAGLRLLEAIAPERVASHQPWWAARAHLLAMAGDPPGAAAAYGRALALTGEPRLRAWLACQRDAALAA
jgi:RNA polymerase sigma-70 factor (ECF subfamily)